MAAYTFRRSGTVVSSSSSAAISPSPGTHGADYFTGDLLILPTVNRAPSVSVTALTGWTQIFSQTAQASIEIWARVADGGANDTPSVDWGGTSRSVAWIDSFYGDVQTTLASLLHASNVGTGASSADPLLPTLENVAHSFTANDCLLYALAVKKATAAGDATAVIAPTGMTLAGSYISNTASGLDVGSAYVQQTTQADWTGNDFNLTETTPEASNYAGVVLALNTLASATTYVKIFAPAAAASASSIEGVVLNAARDTVIGEFTGQAFEAALEGGEAVLLIPVSGITPDGSTLTVTDTPLVVAYNSTNSTDLSAATVVEV